MLTTRPSSVAKLWLLTFDRMVCLIFTELLTERGPEFVAAAYKALAEIIPASITSNKDLTLERLVGMQSGLRDYWALSVLWGATPQDRFSIYQDAPEALKRLGGFHFPPWDSNVLL